MGSKTKLPFAKHQPNLCNLYCALSEISGYVHHPVSCVIETIRRKTILMCYVKFRHLESRVHPFVLLCIHEEAMWDSLCLPHWALRLTAENRSMYLSASRIHQVMAAQYYLQCRGLHAIPSVWSAWRGITCLSGAT